MVEQNARRCLQVTDRAYVLDQGKNAYTGTGRELLSDPKVIALYLGTLAKQPAANQQFLRIKKPPALSDRGFFSSRWLWLLTRVEVLAESVTHVAVATVYLLDLWSDSLLNHCAQDA